VHRHLVWGLVFVLWSWVSLFWSIHPAITVSMAFTYTQLLIASVLVVLYVADQARLEALMFAYVLGSWVSALGTLAAFVEGTQVVYARYAAIGFDPNDLAVYLNVAIVIGWYVGGRSGGVMRLLCWGVIPVAFLAVFLTGSRLGVLVSGMIIAWVLLTGIGLGRRWRSWAPVLLVALASLFVVDLAHDGFTRAATIPYEIRSGTLGNRIPIWNAGLEGFWNRPLIGFGTGTFPFVAERLLGGFHSAHNAFLSVAVGGGVVGLLLWVGLAASALGQRCLLRGPSRAYWVLLGAVLVVSSFILNLEARKVTWLVLSMAAAGGSLCVTVPKGTERP